MAKLIFFQEEKFMKTTIHGYPKIGPNRELKKVVEAYWKGQVSKDELISKASEINLSRVKKAIDNGVDIIPSNDFSLYDFVLIQQLCLM